MTEIQDMLGDLKMRNKLFICMASICMATIMALTPVSACASTLLKRGSSGTQVTLIQTNLKKLGYFTYPKMTGYYGSVTETAVRRFQKANGLSADGIIGKNTLGVLSANLPTKSAVNTKTLLSVVNNTSEYSGALDWFSQVSNIWKRGMNAVVTDVSTGKSFNMKRTYGTNHADVEPLTTEDTQTIKDVWGGFSWERRAVVVQIGEYTLAGSMTAMPHAGLDNKPEGTYVSGRSSGYGWGCNLDAVKDNGIDGHMDIHFKNSRTHTTNIMQKSHQDMVNKAAEYIKTMNLVDSF